MILFWDVLRLEALLQWRSLRFRAAALAFLVATCAPPLVIAGSVRPNSSSSLGAGSYLGWTLDIARLAVMVLAFAMAGNRASVDGQRQLWPALSAAGISGGGFLMRRWLALVTLLACLTALPVAMSAAVAWALRLEPLSVWRYAGPWLLLLLASAAFFSALWLALVTIAGGELGAFFLLTLGRLGLAMTLFYTEDLTGLTFRPNAEWLGLDYALTPLTAGSARGGSSMGWTQDATLTTDRDFDAAQALAWWWPRAVPSLALSLLVLATASAFVRRTLRDLRPLEVSPEHPLRNLMRYVHAGRMRYAPDAALGTERWLIAASFAALALAVWGYERRHADYADLAEQRYRVERHVEDQWTSPLSLTPVSRSLEGELRADGRLDVLSRIRVENRGAEPIVRSAWTLDAFVGVEIRAAGFEIETRREWDRLFLTFEPPLEPGSALLLEARAIGEPREIDFELSWSQGRSMPFSHRYAKFLEARRIDRLALSQDRRLLGPGRLDLTAHRLTPVPRYTTWQLTPPAVLQGERGLELLPEAISPLERVEVSLRAPAGLFVADSCGHRADGLRSRELAGTCSKALKDYRLLGARLEALSGGAGVTLAALPAHVASARQHLPALEQAIALSQRAWPSLEGFSSLVALEWTPEFELDKRGGELKSWSLRQREWSGGQVQDFGNLLILPEDVLVRSEPLEAEPLVKSLLVSKLLSRRQLDAAQYGMLESLLTTAMAHRMG
ncbi:MAG: hypothetical protein AAF725_05520, partial [Acidobacteriota bacterium]